MSIAKIFSAQFVLQATAWLTVLSVMTLLLSIFVIPWLICKLDSRYFLDLESNSTKRSKQRPSLFSLLLRNTIGSVLIVAGVAMLFLPGQGILTIFAGMLLLSFPGKKFLISKLTSRPTVRRSLNWLRIRKNIPEFQWPAENKKTH